MIRCHRIKKSWEQTTYNQRFNYRCKKAMRIEKIEKICFGPPWEGCQGGPEDLSCAEQVLSEARTR